MTNQIVMQIVGLAALGVALFTIAAKIVVICFEQVIKAYFAYKASYMLLLSKEMETPSERVKAILQAVEQRMNGTDS